MEMLIESANWRPYGVARPGKCTITALLTVAVVNYSMRHQIQEACGYYLIHCLHKLPQMQQHGT